MFADAAAVGIVATPPAAIPPIQPRTVPTESGHPPPSAHTQSEGHPSPAANATTPTTTAPTTAAAAATGIGAAQPSGVAHKSGTREQRSDAAHSIAAAGEDTARGGGTGSYLDESADGSVRTAVKAAPVDYGLSGDAELTDDPGRGVAEGTSSRGASSMGMHSVESLEQLPSAGDGIGMHAPHIDGTSGTPTQVGASIGSPALHPLPLSATAAKGDHSGRSRPEQLDSSPRGNTFSEIQSAVAAEIVAAEIANEARENQGAAGVSPDPRVSPADGTNPRIGAMRFRDASPVSGEATGKGAAFGTRTTRSCARGQLFEDAPSTQRFFRGHNDDILCLAIHPARTHAATGQVCTDTLCWYDQHPCRSRWTSCLFILCAQ